MEISDRLLPQFALERVMGEPVDVLAEAISVECLDRPDDPRVQVVPSLVQEAAVRHLVGQRVLEGVLDVGEEASLVEKLRRL
jgi:hypothetical protein